MSEECQIRDISLPSPYAVAGKQTRYAFGLGKIYYYVEQAATIGEIVSSRYFAPAGSGSAATFFLARLFLFLIVAT